MPGGLLNIIAYGNANIIVHGNPTKTFFKKTTHLSAVSRRDLPLGVRCVVSA